ncbi:MULTISPECIES: YnbE family lipoprotein [unclassified Photobacterium]|uniref:YnbE family lipoprotein n=1 Tax=unclassified Photobacterium TaxID=2628852 RepID=UPI000D17249E|nr:MULTISPECIES: YnbE family lipoprotein [unclassified Photobacterium]PSV43072.1 YnbE family lipoprotein [Photobacterium sp. GB-36]PSV54899.1 YnbE family lipoprotein [Photobacterium sp. GB-3]
MITYNKHCQNQDNKSRSDGHFSAVKAAFLLLGLSSIIVISGCTPKVEVALSEKPIVINLNINIKHEINVKADREINELFNDKDIF